MINKNDKRKTVIKPCPCPSYDIFGTEKWLEKQAEEGLRLTEDGLFWDFAVFEKAEPQKVKYRVEAARKGTGMWSENGGEPDPEEIELSRAYSWEYIAKRKDFFIYRSFDDSAREMDTDPEVQAIALNAVKKRRREALISSVFLLLVYPLLLIRGCVTLTAITMGTWWMLLALLFSVIMMVSELRAYLHLRRIQKRLSGGELCPEETSGKKKLIPYFPGKVFRLVLAILLIGSFFRSWGLSIIDEHRTPIARTESAFPFATMVDLAGEGWTEYTETMTGLGENFNSFTEKKDWIAPSVIDYNEQASMKKADGQFLNGGLYMEYYEMRNAFFGRMLESELIRLDRMKKGYELVKVPAFLEEKATVYMNDSRIPTIVFRKGNVVVRAYFYQSTDPAIPVEEWGIIMYQSVREKD